jgi:2-keto-4-pentenoate hydratase/2-oxohepta-3-ene-1,7-dioic acid hydratase in catechol pathway
VEPGREAPKGLEERQVRIARVEKQGQPCFGILEDDEVRELRGDVFGRFEPGVLLGKVSGLPLLAPVLPSKVVALGLNYRDHAAEMNQPLPKEPLIFLKPGTSVIGPGADIIYPGISARVDYEAELAVVIKKRARDVEPQEAGEYILGYTCLNDVTARDLQARDGQWTRAKGFDTFCPLGPWIETELDPSNLDIRAILNDRVVQNSSTNELHFKVHEIISFVSRIMSLVPGDVIATGTPSGVGPMQKGDRITIRIQGIGDLTNHVAGT